MRTGCVPDDVVQKSPFLTPPDRQNTIRTGCAAPFLLINKFITILYIRVRNTRHTRYTRYGPIKNALLAIKKGVSKFRPFGTGAVRHPVRKIHKKTRSGGFTPPTF